MIDPDLASRAAALGVFTRYRLIGGEWREVPAETVARVLATLDAGTAALAHGPLPDDRQPAFLPEALRQGGRIWGLSLQLYGLRSHRNWGIGDFTDLATLVRLAGNAGADAAMINPLHALYRCYPDHVSPYAPSSRLFLNPIYIDVAAVADMPECAAARQRIADPDFAARLDALRSAPLVAYPEVAACKFEILGLLYESFRAYHSGRGTARDAAFARFRARGGEALRRFCTFEALLDVQRHSHPGGWPTWPRGLRDPASDEVAAFEGTQAANIDFAAYLQWIARTQLDGAARAAREGGMRLGLIADIAVGADAAGADTWADQALVASDMELGAPPDPFAPDGQTWGAPPWRPTVLGERGLAPFRGLLDAVMGWAGAVRLDHIIGLERQFWVPRGLSARDGTYVAFPRDALFAAACAASRAHGAAIVGEDLGTVPEGFRNRMRERGMLTTSVMRFEREEGDFVQPGAYPILSIACAGTHDLVPLAGFAAGTDIAAREIAAPGTQDEAAARAARAADVAALARALATEGLAPADMTDPDGMIDSVHRFLARTPSAVVLAQLEDVLGMDVQPNLPGTVAGHPNWRRKYPLEIEDMVTAGTLSHTGALFASEGRGRVAAQ